MGAKHTRQRANDEKTTGAKSSPKGDLGQCVTQTSESETVAPEPARSSKLYRIRKAATRAVSPGLNLPLPERHWEAPPQHSPTGQDINILTAPKRRQRPSLMTVNAGERDSQLPPLVEVPKSLKPSRQPPHKQFTSPTQVLFQRHLQSQRETPQIEFEDDPAPQTFIPTPKEMRHSPAPDVLHATYKIAVPRRASELVAQSAVVRREMGIIGLLREAAEAKYEVQRREGSHMVHDFAPTTRSNLASPMGNGGIMGGFSNLADERIRDVRYKIKSALNLKLPEPMQPATSPKTPNPARLWKGRRGSLLIPSTSVRQ